MNTVKYAKNDLYKKTVKELQGILKKDFPNEKFETDANKDNLVALIVDAQKKGHASHLEDPNAGATEGEGNERGTAAGQNPATVKPEGTDEDGFNDSIDADKDGQVGGDDPEAAAAIAKQRDPNATPGGTAAGKNPETLKGTPKDVQEVKNSDAKNDKDETGLGRSAASEAGSTVSRAEFNQLVDRVAAVERRVNHAGTTHGSTDNLGTIDDLGKRV